MKRISQLFISICAFLFFAAVYLMTAHKSDWLYSTFENRNYATFPTATFASVLDGSYFTDLEDYLIDKAPARTTVLKTKYRIDADVFHRPVINDIVVTDEALLPYLEYTTPDEAKISAQADYQAAELSALQQEIQNYGGSGLLYVEIPGQYLYYGDNYPWYLESKADVLAIEKECFSDALGANNIPYMDFGKNETLLADPSIFGGAIDHHYSLKAAYLAYQAIIEQFNQMGDDALSYTTEDEFEFHPYENHYLGSRARPIFDLAPIQETLYYATFAEDIPYQRYFAGTPTDAPLYVMPSADEEVTYSAYMGWDVAFDMIKTNRPELPTVLIYGDSYTNAIETFLYRSFDTMYSLDLRHYDEKTLLEFVAEYQPDYVVCVRDTSSICDPTGNGSVTNSQPTY